MSTNTRFSANNAYELLVTSVVDYAIYMLDRDGRVVNWNAGAERIKGYTADEIIGEHVSRFYTEEDRAAGAPQRMLATVAETGRFTTEAWRCRKDGSRFWAMVVVDAIRDESGALIGFAKITRDISEQHAAQAALLETERRFRLLVESVVDYAIFMLDTDGRITNWNAGAERIKGYSAAEIIGQHFSRFYTPEDIADGLPVRALETARREGRYEAEGLRCRKDGSRFWASVVIDAVHDNGVLIGFAKVTRDITERRAAQAELEASREQLFQSQKMEAMGQLTGGLAHDFNNLLTAIMGAAELGLLQCGGNEKLRRMLESIRLSAKRGGDLTKQLLAFARRQPLEPKIIHLREQLPLTVQLLRHSLRGDIELIPDFPEDLWAVEADPAQLELALLNLGINARDAMPEGGTLRFSARNVTLKGEIEGLTGDYVALSMADSGIGIPEEIRTRIFEPFFTTKAFGQGTGLGLSQTYGFVQQSNGTITLESEVGRGTTITIYLPSSGVAAAGRDAAERNAGRPIVLVVDDDLSVAEMAGEMIEALGYEPRIANSGAEALGILTRTSGIRLVFSDVVMAGGMSGLELARKLRARYPEMPVLLTSGYSQTMTAAPGEFPFLAKPYNMEQLSASIRRMLGQGSVPEPA